MQQVIDMKCPNCGDAVDTSQKICKSCKQPIVISTFNSVYTMPMPLVNKAAGAYRGVLAQDPMNSEINASIAFCFLKLKMYDKAAEAFEKAVVDNFDNSEIFFYAAVSLLGGKKAFLAQRPTIDKSIEYINAANMIEPKGIYDYLLSYIKYDYFFRKHFMTSPTYDEMLSQAVQTGLSDYDVQQLHEILGVERPSELMV
jgi:tetratricopeptide (TPR) repeat protein